jgi:excisionase family DNA binding protein
MESMNTNVNNRSMLTVPEAAQRLGISPKTAWAWVYSRRLPITRFGNRCVRIPADSLEQLIENNTVPAASEPRP